MSQTVSKRLVCIRDVTENITSLGIDCNDSMCWLGDPGLCTIQVSINSDKHPQMQVWVHSTHLQQLSHAYYCRNVHVVLCSCAKWRSTV
jgi:hypothetical protein